MTRPRLSFSSTELQVTWGGLTARVEGSEVQFGHLGCKMLGTIKDQVKRASLLDQWNVQLGRNWKDTTDSTKRLGKTLAVTTGQASVQGLVLYDTMRKGSDYWRPGQLLTEAVEHLRSEDPHTETSYAREDLLCPPIDLLEESRKHAMPFGQFAERYAQYLRTAGGLELAVALVLLASASGRLAVFYCTDPYIPGYGRPNEMDTETPYTQRHWLLQLPEEGCHRMVLASELIQFLVNKNIAVRLFEIDQTFGKCHVRRYH
jgi:hypothetical protein